MIKSFQRNYMQLVANESFFSQSKNFFFIIIIMYFIFPKALQQIK